MCSLNTLDCHSRPMTFNLNGGNYAYSSGWGVFCTGITLLLLFFYAVEKLFVQDNLSFFTETSIYDPLGTFGEYDGFNMAFALTPYTGLINRRFEHPTNYTLEVYMYRWSVPETSLTTVYNITKLNTHVCTRDELGFGVTREDARFYPIQEDMQQDVYRMIGNWHCLDKFQDINLLGHYSSSQANSLLIRLKKCQTTNTTSCQEVDPSKDL